MKDQLLFLVGLILFTNHLNSQPEKQWLIWNGMGKSGYNTSGNIYSGTLDYRIDSEFTLVGVNPANTYSTTNARNDLFIIYSDGQHFNSRSSANPGFFYNSGDVSSTNGQILETDHHFKKNTTGGVRYLYLTNRYEGDDLPPGVKARKGLYGTPPGPVPSPTYSLDNNTTPTDILTANHEVVFGKDITVIINYNLAKDFKTEQNPQDSIYSLKFDRIQNVGTSAYTDGNDYVDLQPVFETSLSAILPVPATAPETTNEITLKPGQNSYGYVNFRPIPLAPSYFPPYTDGSAQYRAVFVLRKNGQDIAQLAENLRYSHDPNFLQVLAIDKNDDNSHTIKYHLEFENTSDIQAETLSTAVYFPPMFDLSDIDDIKWRAAGKKCHGNMYPSTARANSYNFDFKGHDPIILCTPTQPKLGTAYVEFEVKVRPGFDLSDVNTSLEMDSITVFFDGIRFPLDEFRDLVECNSRPVDGVIICNRPLSTVPGSFCWWWIIAGLILVFIVIWIIKKK